MTRVTGAQRMVVLAGLVACLGDAPAPKPSPSVTDPSPDTRDTAVAPDPLELVVEAAVEPPGAVLLARWFTVGCNTPTTLVLAVAGPEGVREITFPDPATTHRVPLLGLRPDTDYAVTATLTAPTGETIETTPVPLLTGTLPDTVPAVVVGTTTPERMEPGLTLLATNGDPSWILALDATGAVVYAQQVTEALAVVPDLHGNLVLVEGLTVAVRSPMGNLVRRWTAAPTLPQDIPVAYGDFHHDVLPQPDGSFWSLSWRHVEVPEFPESYDQPFSYAPATIRDDLVVHVAADGTTLAEYSLLERLDARRIGFDSLSMSPSGALDWVHANAIELDPIADTLTVSMRHQDAVVSLSASTGELRWIFSAPDGWSPAHQPYLLAPTSPFLWPTHQHGIEIRPDGVLRMFDNGNDLRSTPYATSGEQLAYSRIVEFAIDEEAHTVTPLERFGETGTGLLYASALGNADLLETTGNRLGTWGTVGRIVEFAADGTVVFEVELPARYNVDRAIRIPSLYPPNVSEVVR